MTFLNSKKILFSLLILSFTGGGCTYSKKTPEGTISPSYKKTVSIWTTSGSLHSELDTILIVDALYKNWVVKKSYIEELSQTTALSAEEKSSLFEKKKAEHQKARTFLLAVYTGNEQWNDLDKKDSLWRITLEDSEGEKFQPVNIKEIQQKNIKIKTFYPFITPWKKVYEVEFPKHHPDNNRWPVKLTLSSILGKVELLLTSRSNVID